MVRPIRSANLAQLADSPGRFSFFRANENGPVTMFPQKDFISGG